MPAIYLDHHLNFNCQILIKINLVPNPNPNPNPLDKCSLFGKEYKLKWNLKKCATVSRIPTIFYLDNEPLPCTNQYKYLGIIHKWNGLDLETSYTSALTKANNLLNAISDNSWHPKSRLTIYRSFIRPITEYTSLLTYLWAQKSPSRNHLLELMKSQHQNAIKWIFHRSQYLQILDFLSGLGSWNYRLECLHGGLARSLEQLHDDNPLTAARATYFISSSTNFILPLCFKSQYWSAYQKEKMKNLTFPLRWGTWRYLKLKSLAIESAKSSATIAYTLPFNILSIRATFNLPIGDFSTVIQWRLNRSFLHLVCTCHSSFNRSHIDCVLQSNQIYESYLTSPTYFRSLKIILSSKATTYCVLDFLLNNGEFKDFLYLMDLLRSKLIS